MRRHSLVVSGALLWSLTLLPLLALAADNPFVGTWKLNMAKSQFRPGGAPQSEIMKIEAEDNGLKHTFDMVTAKGDAVHMVGSLKFDEKDYPVSAPDVDTVNARRIDPLTYEYETKKAGKVVRRGHDTVSEDGKSMTRRQARTGRNGEEITEISVYDKQ